MTGQKPSEFARELANQMADGVIEHLPRFTPRATPEFVRECLWAFYAMRDALPAIRADGAESRSLRDRIALASVALEVESAIRDANAWLSRCARRGGRGLPPVDQGRPASKAMAQGCAAVGVGAGAPLVPSPAADITATGDRLSFSPARQELPRPAMRADNQTRGVPA